MSDDRFRRAKDIFLQVRDLSPGDRTPELIRICDGDAAIQDEVVSLLAYYDESGDFLEASALSRIDTLAGHLTSPQDEIVDGSIPSKIGRYTILRKIAAGGMGTVFEAVQENPRRTVALKLLRREYSGGATARRFQYEADILAHLHHPGIAQIYEAGIHREEDLSVHFFAMELIPDATPITEFAARNKLDIESRVRLMIDVCNAVHFGHQHGIIHRDLKPANIVVGRDGKVKVIDFGVARTTNADVFTVSMNTQAGQLLGTPQYMSPEQFDGDPHNIDVRTDVYSLGVVLFELLAGRLPYAIKSPALLSIAETVKHQSPGKLSVVNRQISEDLQTIANKSLEKSADRRYQSAADLRRDLERYQAMMPIEARRPSVAYQFSLFAKRHPGLLASISLAVAILIVATIVSTQFALMARKAEKREAIRAKEAIDARAAEVNARNVAEHRRTEAEFQSYVANIVAADAELRSFGIAEAMMRLERTPLELRNWEYNYLVGMLDQSDRTIRGHTDPVSCVTISQDGTMLASTAGSFPGDDRSIRLWDYESGTLLARYDQFDYNAEEVAFSHDGKYLASCGDNIVNVWRVPNLDEPVFTSSISQTWMQTVAIDGETTRVWAGANDGHIRCWNYLTRNKVYNVELSNDPVLTLELSPDRKFLASGDRNGEIAFVDTADGYVINKFTAHAKAITGIAFHPNGDMFATVSNDGSARFWKLDVDLLLYEFRHHEGEVLGVAFSHDGRITATVGNDKTLRLYDSTSGEELGVFTGHESALSTVVFDPSDNAIITSSWDGDIKVWDVDNLTARQPIDSHRKLIRAVGFSRDSKLLASASFDGTVRVWDVESRRQVGILEDQPRGFQDVSFSPDGETIATAARSGLVQIWDSSTYESLHICKSHEHAVHSVAYHPNGKLIASGGIDQRIIIWDVTSGSPMFELNGHENWIWDLMFLPDEDSLVSASEDGKVICWNLRERKEQDRFEFEGGVQAIALTSNGSTLAVGLASGEVALIDMTSRRETKRFKGHTGNVLDLAFLPDGSRLVSTSHDRGITLVDIPSGEPVLKLRGAKSNVWGVATSPDGRWIATGEGPYGSWDCTVRVWDGANSLKKKQSRTHE